MRIRRRVLAAVVGVAVAATAGFAALSIREHLQEKNACANLREEAGGSFAPEEVHAGTERVTVLGDSYAGGYFLPSTSEGWAFLAAEDAGWDATIAGVGSTGFVHESSCHGDSFRGRMQVMEGADLVILQGGLNDFQEDPAEVADAAAELLNSAPAHARVVVIGPPSAPARPEAQEIDSALSSALADTRAEYVSARDWKDLDYQADGVHLTPSGHKTFAEHIISTLS